MAVAAILLATSAPAAEDVAQLRTTLDALLAAERPAGGWMFASPAGQRAQPFTIVMKIAERVAAPFGLARWDLVVLRSPGTPTAGMALLAGHRLTGEGAYLAGARRAGDMLIALQLGSGGWFSEMPADGDHLSTWFPWVSWRAMIDDDVTPGAIRFLLALWERTGDPRYRAAADRGLGLLLRAQRPDGGWPLVWRPEWLRAVRTSSEDLGSLNDGATPLVIETLVVAARILDRPELLERARAGGRWLVRMQQQPPRAGWAQQYHDDGTASGMRRFEPPALASWETRHAVDALDALAHVDGVLEWCDAVRAAGAWLVAAAVRPGCWSRLYALDTATPIYADADGGIVDLASARAGYDWQGDFGIPALLWRLGIERGPVPPSPAPGDPGLCPGTTDPARKGGGARLLAAEAALLLSRIEPVPPSPCAGGGAQLVGAGPVRAGVVGAQALR